MPAVPHKKISSYIVRNLTRSRREFGPGDAGHPQLHSTAGPPLVPCEPELLATVKLKCRLSLVSENSLQPVSHSQSHHTAVLG